MSEDFIVILFYKFTAISNPKVFAKKHKEKCHELGLLGRMIVAEEGINATFEGKRGNIESYKDFLKSDPLFKDIVIKESLGNGHAFPKLSIKVRDEVVTLGAGRFDIPKETATELSALELENWYKNSEDFLVLDLRNDYEIATGKFDRTVDPKLSNFRDLKDKLTEISHLKDKKVVAVCTGGIRCEKATCLLKREGFSNIYQLKDGIHSYIKEYPGKHFNGTLFVFDNRMTNDIVPTKNKTVIGQCHFCGHHTEKYYSDDSVRPSRKVLCCQTCYMRESVNLRDCTNK